MSVSWPRDGGAVTLGPGWDTVTAGSVPLPRHPVQRGIAVHSVCILLAYSPHGSAAPW